MLTIFFQFICRNRIIVKRSYDCDIADNIKRTRKAVLITFDTDSEKFESNYERNKFFRGLHGWKQIVPKENKKYVYQRKGLLDEVPHKKVSDSVFIIAMENMKIMMDFFDEWHEKVHYEMMEIMMEKDKFLKNVKEKIREEW